MPDAPTREPSQSSRHPSERTLIGVALAILLLVWGTQFLIIRQIREGAPPAVGVAIRFGVVALAAQIAVWLRRARAPAGQRVARFAIGGFKAASTLLVYGAATRAESVWIALVMATGPVFVVVFAPVLVPQERITREVVVAGLLGLGGAGLIVGLPATTAPAAALWMLLGASACGALSKIAAKRLVAKMDPIVMLRDLGAVVFAVALPFAAATAAPVTAGAWAAHIYLGLVGSAAATALYFWVLLRVEVTRLAYLPFATSAIAVLVGVAAGETLDISGLGGAVLIAVGSVVLIRRRRGGSRGSG